LASRKAMMVEGMRPRMPPPSMLRIVTSFPVDGGGCGTVVVSEAVAVPPWLSMTGVDERSGTKEFRKRSLLHLAALL
jgi:hypothetical protein